MPVGRLASKAKTVNVVASWVELDGVPAPYHKHKCQAADCDNDTVGIYKIIIQVLYIFHSLEKWAHMLEKFWFICWKNF